MTKETLSRLNPRRMYREQVATDYCMLQQRQAIKIKTLSQHFHVAMENAIWAKILGIHKAASNLGPKLLGLYK